MLLRMFLIIIRGVYASIEKWLMQQEKLLMVLLMENYIPERTCMTKEEIVLFKNRKLNFVQERYFCSSRNCAFTGPLSGFAIETTEKIWVCLGTAARFKTRCLGWCSQSRCSTPMDIRNMTQNVFRPQTFNWSLCLKKKKKHSPK